MKIVMLLSVDENVNHRQTLFIGDAKTLPPQDLVEIKVVAERYGAVSKVENRVAFFAIVIKVEFEIFTGFKYALAVHVFELGSKADCESVGQIIFLVQPQSEIIIAPVASWDGFKLGNQDLSR